MRIRTIRNKIYTNLKDAFPQFILVKEKGNKINVFSVRTAIVSNLICEICIIPSMLDDHYLIIFSNGRNMREYKTIRAYCTRRNGFSMQTEWDHEDRTNSYDF